MDFPIQEPFDLLIYFGVLRGIFHNQSDRQEFFYLLRALATLFSCTLLCGQAE